jgi:hypothetical protein
LATKYYWWQTAVLLQLQAPLVLLILQASSHWYESCSSPVKGTEQHGVAQPNDGEAREMLKAA